MKHPTPQTPQELELDCLGVIIRACQDVIVSAYAMDYNELMVHYDFLKKQVNRLSVIHTTVQQKPG